MKSLLVLTMLLLLLAISFWAPLAQNAPKAASPNSTSKALTAQSGMTYIEGSVKEHGNLQPVDGVQVELRDPTTSEVLAGTETGADGKFILNVGGLMPGRYVVRISLTSFEDQDQDVTVAADGAAPPPISFVMHCLVRATPPVKRSVVRVFYATSARDVR